jgi:hypothetical protein
VLHFLGGDRRVQPGTQFRECFLCDRKKLLAAAIGRLVLDWTEKAATQEPLKGGIDGARGIAEVAERGGGKRLAYSVAGGGLALEEGEKEMLEMGEASNGEWYATYDR